MRMYWIMGFSLVGVLVVYVLFLFGISAVRDHFTSVDLNDTQEEPASERAVCELPYDVMEDYNWVNAAPSYEWFRARRSIECDPSYDPDDVHPTPVVMEYDGKQDRLHKRAVNMTCKYASVYYRGDQRIGLVDLWKELKEDKPITRDDVRADPLGNPTRFVLVRCNRSSEGTVYEDVHMFMPSLEQFKTRSDNSSQVSVLVLVLESTTRMNFLRSMPKTAQALRENGPVFYMKGFTRIADNTAPNMVAFFSGRLEDDYTHPTLFNRPLDGIFPGVWREYARRGYATAMMDDSPRTARSILGYGKMDGVKRPPTTFYPQPYWTYYERIAGNGDCIPPPISRPVPEVLLEHMDRFVAHADANQRPYFALSMIIRTAHDDWRDDEALDVYYDDFIRRLAKRGALDNTVLIVMGDHGNRFQPEMLHTSMGYIENRLPLMAIRLPPTLLEKHPKMGDRLLTNKKRLTSMLDMHKTLVELAALAGPPKPPKGRQDALYTSNAYSLIRELVPLNRSCEDARIPELYCVCKMRELLTVDQALMQELAAQFVEQLNEILPENKCRRLSLAEIKSAAMFEQDAFVDRLTFKQQVELTVAVAPSGALLRTRLSRTAFTSWTKVWVGHEIERLNLYGNQSHCIEHRVLRKYCICHDIVGLLDNLAPNSTTLAPTNSSSPNSTLSP